VNRSSRRRTMIDILKDALIIILAVPTVALFIVLALGRSVAEPVLAIAMVELGLSTAVLVAAVIMLYVDLKEAKR